MEGDDRLAREPRQLNKHARFRKFPLPHSIPNFLLKNSHPQIPAITKTSQRKTSIFKKSGLILLRLRREDACITFLKRSYSSSDLLRKLMPRVALTRPYALRTGETVSVPASPRSNIFGNFGNIKYQNHV